MKTNQDYICEEVSAILARYVNEGATMREIIAALDDAKSEAPFILAKRVAA